VIKQTTRKNRIIALVLFMVTMWAIILNWLLLPKLDVDTYHDGFIYPMALQQSKGYIPNKDFFSLYGPVAPVISGLWVRVFGESLLILRLYGAFIITLIAILMYLIVRKHLNNTVALVFCLVWLLGNPLIVHPSLPWVDLHTTLILIFATFLFTNTKLSQLKYGKKAYVVGLFLGLGVFTKVNFGLVVAVFIALISYLFGIRVAIRVLFGAVTSGSFVVLYMMLNESLVPYLEQTIYFAWLQHDEGKQLRGLINVKSILFGSILILIFFLLERHKDQFSLLRRPVWKYMFACLSCVTWFIVAFRFRHFEEPFIAITLDPIAILKNLLQNLLYFPLFASIFLLPIVFLFALWAKRDLIGARKLNPEVFLGTLCLAYIVQLYPNPEPAHIWYIFPIVTIGVLNLLSEQKHKQILNSITKYVITPTICGLIVINIQLLSVLRVNHQAEPLYGMMSRPEAVSRIDKTLYLLSFYVSNGTVKFDCPKGIYSVFSNTFFASDYQYVDIIPQYYKDKVPAPLTFECELELDKIIDIRGNHEVVFETEGELPGLKNILYKNS